MIERKDGEADASWIGRLEAAYKALIPACESLEKKLGAAQQETAQFAFYLGVADGLLMRARPSLDDFVTPGLEEDINAHLKSVSQWRYPDPPQL